MDQLELTTEKLGGSKENAAKEKEGGREGLTVVSPRLVAAAALISGVMVFEVHNRWSCLLESVRRRA